MPKAASGEASRPTSWKSSNPPSSRAAKKGTAPPTDGARAVALRQKSARAASVMGSGLGLGGPSRPRSPVRQGRGQLVDHALDGELPIAAQAGRGAEPAAPPRLRAVGVRKLR